MELLQEVQDIPKFYTALAEWLSCLMMICLLKRRRSNLWIAVFSAGSLVLLAVIQQLIGAARVELWLPGMLLAMFLMYGYLYVCLDVSVSGAGFLWAMAFMLAEFAAAIQWQLFSFFYNGKAAPLYLSGLFLVLIYGVIFVGCYFLVRKHMESDRRYHVEIRDMTEAVVIAVCFFLFSNVSYVFENSPFSGVVLPAIFYIRSLVDFTGLIVLWMLKKSIDERTLHRELEEIQKLLYLRFEQYKQSKKNIEMINRKYHDIKHQLQVIRMEKDQERRDAYIDSMEQEIQKYEAENKTGNDVLDIILTEKNMYCLQHQINFTCVAEGELLDFMDAMDISALFGNAIDNAIESQLKVGDKKKRVVKIAVYRKKQFLMLRFENYFDQDIRMDQGIPVTSKKDAAMHGYGIPSIRYIAEKYGGTMTVHKGDHWFDLRVLIPLKTNAETSSHTIHHI